MKLIFSIIILLISISFVSAFDESQFDFTYTTPINYSTIATVNNSNFWDDLDTPTDIEYTDVGGDSFWDGDIDMTPYSITLDTFFGDWGGGNIDSNVDMDNNNLETTGNITADTYFGDGSQLTGIASGVNGTNLNVLGINATNITADTYFGDWGNYFIDFWNTTRHFTIEQRAIGQGARFTTNDFFDFYTDSKRIMKIGGDGGIDDIEIYVNTNATGFNITADTYFGDGSELTGIVGDNSSWNESMAYGLFLNRTSESDYLSTYNVTYDAKVSNNESWNQSYANGLYYGIGNPSNFYNSTTLSLSDYWNMSENAYTTKGITAEGGFSALSNELIDDWEFDGTGNWTKDASWTVTGGQAVHDFPYAVDDLVEVSPFIPVVDGIYSVQINISSNGGEGLNVTMCGITEKILQFTTGLNSYTFTCLNTDTLVMTQLGGPIVLNSLSIKKVGASTFGGTTFVGNVVMNAGFSVASATFKQLTMNGEEATSLKTYFINITGGTASVGVDGDDIIITGTRGGEKNPATSNLGDAGNIYLTTQQGGSKGLSASGSIINTISNGAVTTSGVLNNAPGAGQYIWYGGNGTDIHSGAFGLGGTPTSYKFYAGSSGNSVNGPGSSNGVPGGGFWFQTGKNGTNGGGTEAYLGTIHLAPTGGNTMLGNTTVPSYPLTVYGATSGISAWFEENISATGYNTRTSVFDKTDGSALSKTHDASYYLKEDGITINHTAFDGGRCYELIDYDNPIITIKWCDVELWKKTGESICQEIKPISKDYEKFEEITYPNKTECDMPLSKMVVKHEQGIYDLNVILQDKLNKYDTCLESSKDFLEYKGCVAH